MSCLAPFHAYTDLLHWCFQLTPSLFIFHHYILAMTSDNPESYPLSVSVLSLCWAVRCIKINCTSAVDCSQLWGMGGRFGFIVPPNKFLTAAIGHRAITSSDRADSLLRTWHISSHRILIRWGAVKEGWAGCPSYCSEYSTYLYLILFPKDYTTESILGWPPTLSFQSPLILKVSLIITG